MISGFIENLSLLYAALKIEEYQTSLKVHRGSMYNVGSEMPPRLVKKSPRNCGRPAVKNFSEFNYFLIHNILNRH